MIAILLSTYNGERFLEEQIYSIISQTVSDWKLYITDDGSIDKTIDIIKYFTTSYNNIFYLHSPSHKGAKNSYIWLLNEIHENYYMFCDQDDVWLPSKISKTFSYMIKIQKENPNKPILVHSDLIVVDENMHVISDSFSNYANLYLKDKSFNFYSAFNNVTGCTVMINKIARDLSLFPPTTFGMHDSWISKVVSFHNGIIEYIHDPLIKYRQHNNNTIGAKQDESFMKKCTNIHNILSSNIILFKEVTYLSDMGIFRFVICKFYYFIKKLMYL
jgi:glycosyltransferase involved in cell wall biosynthesis